MWDGYERATPQYNGFDEVVQSTGSWADEKGDRIVHISFHGRVGRMTIHISLSDSGRSMSLDEAKQRMRRLADIIGGNLPGIQIDGGGSLHKPRLDEDFYAEARAKDRNMTALRRLAASYGRMPPEKQKEFLRLLRGLTSEQRSQLPPSLLKLLE